MVRCCRCNGTQARDVAGSITFYQGESVHFAVAEVVGLDAAAVGVVLEAARFQDLPTRAVQDVDGFLDQPAARVEHATALLVTHVRLDQVCLRVEAPGMLVVDEIGGVILLLDQISGVVVPAQVSASAPCRAFRCKCRSAAPPGGRFSPDPRARRLRDRFAAPRRRWPARGTRAGPTMRLQWRCAA